MYLIHLSRVRFSCSNKINNLRCGTLLAVQRISNRLTKYHDQWPNFIKVSHFIFWHLAKGGNMLRNLLINFGMFALLFVGISGGTWFVSDAAASEPQKAEAVESPTPTPTPCPSPEDPENPCPTPTPTPTDPLPVPTEEPSPEPTPEDPEPTPTPFG